MSTMLTYVPITRPSRPNTIRQMFLMNMIMQGPKSRSGQSTQISMIAGNAIPRAERQSAPNREMKRPSLGTVMANVTAKEKEKKKRKENSFAFSTGQNAKRRKRDLFCEIFLSI